MERAKNLRIGALGEAIASKYLENKGFLILSRNYRMKCGEIDIIAEKGGVIHFVEVKSVSCEIFDNSGPHVSRETDAFRPEDNSHPGKLKRIFRTLQVFLAEKYTNKAPDWQVDAITVKLDLNSRRSIVKFMDNIVVN